MAEVSGFSQLLEFMSKADAFELLLPFLLSWMVYYIALEKADFLFPEGEKSLQKLPPVIALIMAFFTAQFIAVNPWYQTFFMDFFGKITIGVIGILGLLTMLAFVGYEKKVLSNFSFVLFILAAVGAAFIYAGGFGPPLVENIGLLAVAQELFLWLLETGAIWGVVILLTVAWIMKEPDNNGDSTSFLDLLAGSDVEFNTEKEKENG